MTPAVYHAFSNELQKLALWGQIANAGFKAAPGFLRSGARSIAKATGAQGAAAVTGRAKNILAGGAIGAAGLGAAGGGFLAGRATD